jgi:hypothetical protein
MPLSLPLALAFCSALDGQELTEHQKREAIRRDAGDETLAEIGGSYNVNGWTISRLNGAS